MYYWDIPRLHVQQIKSAQQSRTSCHNKICKALQQRGRAERCVLLKCIRKS